MTEDESFLSLSNVTRNDVLSSGNYGKPPCRVIFFTMPFIRGRLLLGPAGRANLVFAGVLSSVQSA